MTTDLQNDILPKIGNFVRRALTRVGITRLSHLSFLEQEP
jgi:hypothetical protein